MSNDTILIVGLLFAVVAIGSIFWFAQRLDRSHKEEQGGKEPLSFPKILIIIIAAGIGIILAVKIAAPMGIGAVLAGLLIVAGLTGTLMGALR